MFAAGLTPVDARDAIVVIERMERLGRRLDAAKASLVGAIDRHGHHREDKHASAKVMVRHVGQLGDAEAAKRAKAAKALRDLPLVREAWQRGQLGTDQVARIARVHANTRVRDALIAAEEGFVRRAKARSYRSFDAWVTGWVERMDVDGTCDQSQRNHENRDGSMVQDFNRAWELKANGGELAGLQMHDIWRHFIEAEFKTDWQKCVAEYGDAASVDKLHRTDAQRRFDALLEIFLRAASTPPGGARPRVVTNIVIDWQTYQNELVRLAGATPAAPDPNDDTTFRCSSIDGHALGPTEGVAASLLAEVRRVVVGANGVTIDMSRRQRLFRGSAALAARLASVYCYWPGCYVPASQCQIDHLTPFADRDGGAGGGETNPGNGGPACGRHNRSKEHGYSVWRDETGAWHVLRPDGSELR